MFATLRWGWPRSPGATLLAMEPSQPDASRERGRLLWALVAVTAGLSLLVAGVGAYGYVNYVEAGNGIVHPPQVSTAPPIDFGPCVDNVCNYLILGSDSRTGLSANQQYHFGTNKDIGGTLRSDVIILVHTDPRAQRATLLSFPRDLWVPIPGHGKNKINSAFEGGINGGGPQLVTKTVEDLTGIHINHYLYIDLARFQHIVDAIGGVQLCIPTAMHDILTGLDVQAGCQTLNGYQALAYVRTRHQPCDYVPDFSRIGRQQQFLRAVLNRILQPSEIAHATTLIKDVARSLVADKGFQLADIINLVHQIQGISTGQVDFRTVPGTAVNIYPGGVFTSIVRMDPKAKLLFDALRADKPLPAGIGTQLEQTAPSEANVITAVVDHSSNASAAAVEQVASQSGFDIAPGILQYAAIPGLSKIKGSAIVYKPGDQLQAQVVAKYFPGLKMIEAPKGALTTSMVAVVVSPGYKPQPVGAGGVSPTNCQVLNP